MQFILGPNSIGIPNKFLKFFTLKLKISKGNIISEEVPVPKVKKGHILIRTKKSLVSLGTEKMLIEFGKANLFQKINSNILENSVPNNLRDPRNKWFGLTRRLRVIITNPDIVDITKIKNFEDLTNPSFKGKVCLRNRKSP